MYFLPIQAKAKLHTSWPIILIISVALIVRLYQLTTPLADWHSFRQADTASVAREYVKHGIDLLHPRYHDLSDIQSGKANLQGWRMVEFPLIPALVAATYPIGNLLNLQLHVWFRLLNIFVSLGSLYLLYRLADLFGDRRLGLATALIYAILPYNIYYSRTTLPEVALTFFSLAAVFFLIKPLWSNKRTNAPYIWLGAVFGSLAMLTKPTAVFYLLVAIYVIWRHLGRKFFYPTVLIPLIIMFVPTLLWRQWIARYPEGVPVYEWLLNGNGIRFTPAFFRWLFAERLAKLILGYWGVILFGFGLQSLSSRHPESFDKLKTKFAHDKLESGSRSLIDSFKKHYLQFKQRFSSADPKPPHLDRFITVWGLSLLAYLTIFATGNVQHDYYQIITIPIICVIIARGLIYLLGYRKLTSYLILLTSLIFMLGFSWYEVRGLYQINNWAIVKAGQYVDRHTESDALIIAPYQGDTAFLYQTNRRGWPLGFHIQDKIDQGADYYVSTTYDTEARELEQRYPVIEKNSDFILIKLSPSIPPVL